MELTNEGMKDMKARIVMIIMAVALIALPTMAQQQEWKSTSAMQTSGSNYAPQVNAVGATSVNEMATTTASYSPNGPRRAKMDDDDWGTNPHVGEGDEGSPIGDAVLPLALMAMLFAGVVYTRRRKALS